MINYFMPERPSGKDIEYEFRLITGLAQRISNQVMNLLFN